ncbi:MAG: cytochrome-c oxidase, cbb3-type subunit II, partial [Crocinitomicaceae bacterium]|nr:cytochrome-c oxidase, cbb3-type subunit II [Crocinitomicaceae bacterium]
LTCYGMATFEGPMLSLKNVNWISHFTDWTIAHVHVGGLGWNGMFTFGMAYYLVPKMWRTTIYSRSMTNTHFWLATLGIILWVIPMYWAGFTQGLMWKDFNADGSLAHPNFLETVTQLRPFYMLRALGGAMFIAGAVVMVVNLVKTAKQGSFLKDEDAEAPALQPAPAHATGKHWHTAIERRPLRFLLFALIAILIGGIVELVPTFMVGSNVPKIASVQPYTPLELEGRDIYIREGCYNCHSQWVRPFRDEVKRYGEYSKSGEFVYDHPFQWGSKRTGPDLHRSGVGNAMNKPESWHYKHMIDPRYSSPGTIMPAYPWLMDKLDVSQTTNKISAMRTIGVPYPEGYEAQALDDLNKQAEEIYQAIITQDPEIKNARPDMELIALIAYLERLGSDIHKGEKPEVEEVEVSAQTIVEPVDSAAVTSTADTTNTSH